MSAPALEWVEVWKWDHLHWPEKVRVVKIDHDYYLEEGKTSTSYRGSYFETPEAAFDHAIDECRRRAEQYTRDKEFLERKRENFFKKNKQN